MRFDAENKGVRRFCKLFFPRVDFDELAYGFLPVGTVLENEAKNGQKVGCLALDLLDRRRTALLEDFRPCGVASADRRASRARMRSHAPAYAPADKPVLIAPGLFSFPLAFLL